MSYKSIGIRLEGTEEQIEEALKRCRWAFCISSPRYQASSQHPGLTCCYIRGYFYPSATPSPFDEIALIKAENARLCMALGEAEIKIQELQQQLKTIPKPPKDGAVLGTPHR